MSNSRAESANFIIRFAITYRVLAIHHGYKRGAGAGKHWTLIEISPFPSTVTQGTNKKGIISVLAFILLPQRNFLI